MKSIQSSRRSVLIGSAAMFLAAPAIAQRRPVRLRYAHSQPVGHSTDTAARRFIEIVQAKTNGEATIELFPNNQLGVDRELQTLIETGQLDFTHSNSATMGNFLPQIAVMDLPFTWRSAEHYFRVVDGPFTPALNELLAARTGHRYLGWWYDGFRHVYTRNKAIKSFDDMRGLKIRAPEARVFVDTFRALRANPTPLPFPEIYTALEAGVIDGFEGSNGIVQSSKIYEVAKNRAVTGHIMVGFGLTTGKRFATLPADVQAVCVAAAKDVEASQRASELATEADLVRQMISAGVVESTPDLAPFRAAVEPVHAEFHQRNKTEALRNFINAAAAG